MKSHQPAVPSRKAGDALLLAPLMHCIRKDATIEAAAHCLRYLPKDPRLRSIGRTTSKDPRGILAAVAATTTTITKSSRVISSKRIDSSSTSSSSDRTYNTTTTAATTICCRARKRISRKRGRNSSVVGRSRSIRRRTVVKSSDAVAAISVVLPVVTASKGRHPLSSRPSIVAVDQARKEAIGGTVQHRAPSSSYESKRIPGEQLRRSRRRRRRCLRRPVQQFARDVVV